MTTRHGHARLRAAASAAVATLVAATLVSCSTEASPVDSENPAAARVPFQVRTNVGGRGPVPVDRLVKVTASGGRLTSVSVTSDQGAVDGAVAGKGRRWVAAERLEPGTAYDVEIVAETEAGETRRTTKQFRTADLSLDQQTFPTVAPLDGETVGVGMPVIVTFDVAVTDRATMEKHMHVTSVPSQEGSWHWLNDNEVHWRPAKYWQAGSKVSVDLDINGVPAGGGIYGQESRHIDFTIGDAHVYKVNAQTHEMKVYSNGRLLRTLPITTGKEGFTTRSGTKVIIEKFRRKRMNSETVGINEGDPEFYDIDDVEYAMRLTYSGEFIHAAPWSVGQQGSANVSHGCTGMSTANAGWLYNMTIRGDVVEYVGTDRPMEFGNGWGDWNLPFSQYAAGSAL